MKKAVYIDGNSLMHRAFYALPISMRRSDGLTTNAIFGFYTMLLRIVEEIEPDYLAVAFDVHEKTFRHKMYDEYKAGRVKTPAELVEQFPVLKQSLNEIGIKTLELPGFEADDILGTLSRMGDSSGVKTAVVTGDRDALQLISEDTTVYLTRKGTSETEVFDEAHLREVFGIEPLQVTDLKGLMGDSSDNIPGVKGVGEKTAIKLLSEYGTVECLYEKIGELPESKLKEKLVEGKESAFFSKQLATIVRDAPIGAEISDTAFGGFENEKVSKVFGDLQFTSLLKRFGAEKKKEETVCLETDCARVAEIIGKTKRLAVAAEGREVYFSVKKGTEYCITTEQSLFSDSETIEKVLKTLEPYFSDPEVETVLHGAKSFMHLLDEFGIEPPANYFDTEIASYVIDPTRRKYGYEKLTEYYSITGHAAPLFFISEDQKNTILEKGLERILYEIEIPLERVLFEMEKEGFRIDRAKLIELQKKYTDRMEDLEKDIYDLAGHSFNILSPKQLGEVLFEELLLPVKKKTKTGYSTDAEVLESIEDLHPIIEKVLDYRTVSKLKSTYIDGLLSLASSDGKIHTTFFQTTTATGRISSVEPNLQNIPVRSELSKEIREVFLPSDDTRILISADYSQIELRVLAHMADDENMKDAFIKGEDIHRRTASEVFGMPLEEVPAELRSRAKAVNFGIVYGISDFGLAKQLHIPRYMAADFINKYLKEFSGVDRYMKESVQSARLTGYSKTLFGRIRPVDELKSANFNTRSFGERIAMNTPIQGTAADIIKLAMIRVAGVLKEKKLESRLILQVHDELIVDAPEKEKDEVVDILTREMASVCKLSVPLIANAAWGKNWAEAK